MGCGTTFTIRLPIPGHTELDPETPVATTTTNA
jgi:hypothetical protein